MLQYQKINKYIFTHIVVFLRWFIVSTVLLEAINTITYLYVNSLELTLTI